MRSSVLNSERAIQLDIAIMRAFMKLRHAVLAHQTIARPHPPLDRVILLYVKHGSNKGRIRHPLALIHLTVPKLRRIAPVIRRPLSPPRLEEVTE